MRELLAEVRQSRDQWQAQAEDWKTQTTRLTLALPAPAPGPVATARSVRAAPVMVPLVVRLADGRLSERSVAFDTRVRPRSLAYQPLETPFPRYGGNRVARPQRPAHAPFGR